MDREDFRLEQQGRAAVEKIVLTAASDDLCRAASRSVRERLGQWGVFAQLVPGGEQRADARQWLRAQLRGEQAALARARRAPGERAMILCEGGAMDAGARLSRAAFVRALEDAAVGEVALRDGYDAVFCLISGDDGDARRIQAWTGNSHLRMIDCRQGFAQGEARLLAQVEAFAGLPRPLEIERKFLIAYPDLARLERNPFCRRVEIEQTYLTGADGAEMRLRRRGERGQSVYFLTRKRRLSERTRVEIERRLTREEYLALLEKAGARRTLRKTRYCLAYDMQYFEIDVYGFWQDRATMEIELLCEDEEIRFPPETRVLADVSGVAAYTSANLAREGGGESKDL